MSLNYYYIKTDKISSTAVNLVNLYTEMAQMVMLLMKANFHNAFDSVTFGINAITFNSINSFTVESAKATRIDLVAI